MARGNLLPSDGDIVFKGWLQLPHGPLLLPDPDHVDGTREGIREDKDKEDDHWFHDDDDHGKDNKDEEAEGFSAGKIEFLKTEVPNVGNHEKGEDIDHEQDDDVFNPPCLDQTEIEKDRQGDHGSGCGNRKAFEVFRVAGGRHHIESG
jgi:hypothetical protein